MPQHQQWITLDSCLTDYMMESEQSNTSYLKLFHIACRGMDNMGIDFFYAVQSLKLPVNANLTVTLPPNCIKVTKAGVFNDQGELIPLSQNSNLSTAFDLQPTRLSQTQDNTIVSLYNPQGIVWYNYWNGFSLSNLYGIPSGSPFIGSYKIDNGNGVLVLNESFSYDYVVVECIVSPSENGTYYVPIQFREAIIAWLAWIDIRSVPSSRRGNLGDKRDRKSEFYNQRRLAIAQYDPCILADCYEWLLKNQRLAVKS